MNKAFGLKFWSSTLENHTGFPTSPVRLYFDILEKATIINKTSNTAKNKERGKKCQTKEQMFSTKIQSQDCDK